MWEWDRANGPDKAKVIDELITWISVPLERPQGLQALNFIDLHPAVNVLRTLGLEIIEPLERRLLADPEPAQAKLMAQLLQHQTYAHSQDVGNTRLLVLKGRTNSARLKAVIDEVDDETRLHTKKPDDEVVQPLKITPGNTSGNN